MGKMDQDYYVTFGQIAEHSRQKKECKHYECIYLLLCMIMIMAWKMIDSAHDGGLLAAATRKRAIMLCAL
jgi:hypothetical protein